MTDTDVDLDSMSTATIHSIITRGTAILVERASGVSASVPVQFELLEIDAPIDAAAVDLTEKLSDGSPRYVPRKVAAGLLFCSVDKVKDLATKGNAGFQVGSTWWIDRTRIARRTKR